ncbi:MAG: ATP-dependent zinc metalloprotease FtsH [Acidimicrobiales bacterium]
MARRHGRRRFYRRAAFWVALCIPALVALYAGLLWYTVPSSPGQEVPLAQFQALPENSGIQAATLKSEDNRLQYVAAGRHYWVALPTKGDYVNGFLSDILAKGVPVRVDQQKLTQLVLPATYVVPALVIVAAFLLFFLLMRSSASSPFLKAAARRGSSEHPLTFADVAGADEAVAEAREIRDYLRSPERFAAIGAEAPRGILLVGPPGTGKTLLARAVAGEAGVAFFSMSGADFVELYVGVGAARVRDLFRQVRERAPAILFIDELDALGRTRVGSGTAGQDERDQTLNQLLVELDGFDRGTGVVLIGATNRPDVLDPALLRRGRFDRQIVVDRPDRLGRLAILEVHARGKALDPSVDLGRLATDTPGLTGADLAAVLNEAALLASRRSRRTIGDDDLDLALDRVLNGSEARAQVLTPAERRAVAYHEAGHVVVGLAVPGAPPVRRVSIVGRAKALGSTWTAPGDDRTVQGKAELDAQLASVMAGRAADELVLGQPTTGSRDDLRHATDLARRMVCELGMSETLGRRALGRPLDGSFLGGGRFEADYSAEVAAEVDREIGRLVDGGFRRATAVLTANRPVLDELVRLLLARETLRAEDLATFATRLRASAAGPVPAPPSPMATPAASPPRWTGR